MMYKRILIFLCAIVVGVFTCNGKAKISAEETLAVQMNGRLEQGELFDIQILDVGEDPTNPTGSPDKLIFINDAYISDGENPLGTTAVKCQQYLKVVLSNQADNAILFLYVDNTAIDPTNRTPYGARLEEDASFSPTTEELVYEHPYVDPDGNLGFVDGKKPIDFEAGIIGTVFNSDGRGIVPVFWQVYEEWPGVGNEPAYDYDKPYEPDMNRDPQYRSPNDWWAGIVEKYKLDWDWKIDFEEGSDNYGHFVQDTTFGDPDNNHWVPMINYRTGLFQDGWLGHYPGKRNASGYRVDSNGIQIDVDTIGNPGSLDWGIRQTAEEDVGDGNGEFGYDAYIYFGANLTGKSGQSYETTIYVGIEYETEAVDPSTGELIKDIRLLAVPAECKYKSERELSKITKDKNTGEESTLDIINFPSGLNGVTADQYLEISAESNLPGDRVVMYMDNTYNGLTNYKFDGSRVIYDVNYQPTANEVAYYNDKGGHPYPDSNHSLTVPDTALYEKYGYTTEAEQKKIQNGLKPSSFVVGMVLYTADGTSDQVTPVFWRVYDEELYGGSYPEYTDSNSPWDNGGPTEAGWATLLDKYSFEWDWQLEYDANGSTGHFKVYDPEETNGVDSDTGWMPMKHYRTAIDEFGNLGSYPHQNRTGESPVYLYFGANYYGVTPGYYGTKRLMIEFENDNE